MTAAPLHVAAKHGFPGFSAPELERRHAQIRQALRDDSLDALLLYGAGRFHADVQYVSNWPGGREAFVLLPVDGDPVVLAQLFNHVPTARAISAITDTRWAGRDSVATVIGILRERLGPDGRVALAGELPFTAYRRLSEALSEAQLVDWNPRFRRLRLVRSDEELAFFRIAAELTDRALDRLAAELRPGLREDELAALIEGPALEAGGYAGIHYLTSTSMSSPHALAYVPRQYASDRVLQRGDAVISEIGNAYWGYAGQIHRTFCLGQPTDDWRRMHAVAEEAYAAIEGVLRDGATVGDVLNAADVIHERGYTIFDDLLHGAHQYPPIIKTRATAHANPPEDFVFKTGMVITIQPQLTTLDQRIGLQFGETVVVRPNGTERLHRFPRTLVIV